MTEVFDQKIDEFNAKPKLIKYRILCTIDDYQEQENKLKPIYDEYEDDPIRYVQEVVNIADNYQIAKVKHKRKGKSSEILYHVYVDFKRLNICTYSLDTAIIEAITHKHNCGQATVWVERMLGIKAEPQYED